MSKIVLIILIFFVAAAANSQQLFQPFNLDFEDGAPMKPPVAWEVPFKFEKMGYEAILDTNNPYNGAMCLRLSTDREYSDSLYGSCMQSVYAEPFRGRRLRITAALRAEPGDSLSFAQLWLAYDNESDIPGELFTLETAISSDNWETYEIVAEIGPDAGRINYGVLLQGNGQVWMDEFDIEVIDPIGYEFEQPRPTDSIGIANLEAFARIYGLARFFNTSTEASGIDWDKFAVAGVRAVESAESAEDLSDRLNELFGPIAPAIQISKNAAFDKYRKPDDALPKIALAWMHKGGYVPMRNPFFGSDIVNLYQSLRRSEGSVMQMIEATPYRGKKVEFSAYVRTDMAGPASHAQLWMRVDREHNRVALLKNMDANPIVSKDWQRYSIEADIPESAEIIRLGLVMIGEGEVYFDDVQFTAPGVDPKSDDSRLQNGGFEEYANSDFVPGWLLQRSVERAGYDATQTNRGAYAGEMCLKISSDPSTRIDFPSPGEQYIDEAARDIYFAIPLSLYVDTATTLPRGNLAIDYERYLPGKDFRADGRDRASRLATVIVMWNVIRHFHSFELDEARLDAAFRLALAEAAEDKSRVDFLRTLQKFGSNLDDSQSRVWYGFSRERYGIPLLWTYSNGNLIVTNTRGNTGLHPGDIITEINDQPVDNIIREKGQYISASAPDFRNVRALAELRAGPKNSIVKIKAKSGGKLREIALRRSILLTQLNESRPDEITELDDDIFYVDMNRVRDEEFQDNLDRLKSARGIIFDCRGAATLSEYVLGFFLDKTVRNVAWDIPIFTAPYQRLVSHSYIHTPIAAIDTQLTSDVVFLADARSIGYSEVILAMADHYGIGEIVGHSGGGIAGETYPVRLPGEYAISLTAMKPVGPDGNVLRGKNFKPDYEVYITSESARNGVDPFIEKALEILK